MKKDMFFIILSMSEVSLNTVNDSSISADSSLYKSLTFSVPLLITSISSEVLFTASKFLFIAESNLI